MQATSNVVKMNRSPRYNFNEFNEREYTKRNNKRKPDRSSRENKRNYDVQY